MSILTAPSIQQIGTISETSGAFGTSAFGTAPFGGNEYPLWELPTNLLPGDVLTGGKRYRVDAVQLKRDGVIIGERSRGKILVWRLRHIVTPTDLDQLAYYHILRTFYFWPNGRDGGQKHTVRWNELDFDPTPLRGNRHEIQYELETTG